ncbi:hypothetical protein [Campylobacter troglodytis]|uniref:hypothetical protein n=1 Tax=Campylobacter troglodytis TaxID=654363 RepID=UPI00115A9800|nr:hypothetical protein [Campylobacter troglodytis]TQR60800.1 hypothetical protein DMC01_04085 [Campylobacter troglodytis]
MSKNLEDLDLREVSQKTQIEIEFLDAIVKKDYKKLQRFNVKGFVKIIKREFDIDLSKFIEEYENFLNKDKEEPSKKTPETPTPTNKISTDVEQYTKESGNSWIWGVVLILVIVLVWAVYQYDLLKLLLNDEQRENASVAVVEILDEATNNIQLVSENKEDNNESIAQEEQNITKEEETKQGLSQQEQINNILKETNTKAKEAVFSTDGKVWVGFIDLTNRSKTATVTENNFTVDLTKDQLLLIGATALTLVDDTGAEQKFPAGSSKRFLVKDGKIKNISLAEFMSYNKGKEW